MCSTRLRGIRNSLGRVERSLQTSVAICDCHSCDSVWSEKGNRTWLALAIIVFGYLKHGQLVAMNRYGYSEDSYAEVASAVLRTGSIAGNYYVTIMFMDHVFLAKRLVDARYQ